jgi:hypothetical protein
MILETERESDDGELQEEAREEIEERFEERHDADASDGEAEAEAMGRSHPAADGREPGACCPPPAIEACFLYAVADLSDLARDYPSDAALLSSIAQILDGFSRLAVGCLGVGANSSARS